MIIEFLVATTNRTSLVFLESIFKQVDNSQFKILVINQCYEIAIPENIYNPYENVRVISVSERGTSKSRNLALKNAVGDILTFTDDDLVYASNAVEIVLGIFSGHNEVDLITLKMGLIGSKNDYKSYRNEGFKHNCLTVLQAGDCVIFFRRASWNKTTIFLNEQFGLGAPYPVGEYQIFLSDAIKSGFSCEFVPKKVAYHPDEVTTGTRFDQNSEIGRGALYARLFKTLAPAASVYFAIKNYNRYKVVRGFFSEIYLLMRGSVKYWLRKDV